MHLGHYLTLLQKAQVRLAEAYEEAGSAHREEPDIFHLCQQIGGQCARHAERLAPFARSYVDDDSREPENLHSDLFRGPRSGGLGLLRDLQDLYVMTAECDICWMLIGQAAQGARDEDLVQLVVESEGETANQLAWLRTRMKQAAPQALVVA
jgi:hypothetical protein